MKFFLVCLLVIFKIVLSNSEIPSIGVCYYPEHWKFQKISQDILEMKKLGIKHVRIGEFMWSTIEPFENHYNWTIIDETLRECFKNKINVILGTPTATPPKWLIDKFGGNGQDSTILVFDEKLHPRRFGSRRHYSFSSKDYQEASKNIVTLMAQRYGNHPSVTGWQTDNEYGCHDTVQSFDKNAVLEFRKWLINKYKNNVKLLNEKWGTKFWSAEYNSFDEIDLPSSTVTEPFPSQLLDFYRFSSDQVVSYNKLQTEIIRRYSPNRFITHNFMGFFFQFDHYKVMKELDFSSWDSYPLGFTDTTLGLGEMFSDEIKIRYAKTGHPDIASFHHDLYSSLTANGRNRNELENRGKFWIMEQQPGPVNWGDHNPSPAKGMVRLWSWEAFAHHASVVSYFRWRQVPFAQEQMHSGLLLSNDEKADGYFEAESVINEIDKLKTYFESRNETKSSVGMIFDYTTQWALKIKPQGKGFQYVKLFYSMYSKLRALGVDVDILKPGNDLTQYSLVVVPSLPIVSQEALTSFKNYKEKNPKGLLVFGPRSGSITENFEIPANLAPGKLSEILSIKIPKVESFRDGAPLKASVDFDQKSFPYTIWKEVIQLKQNENIEILGKFEDGTPAIVSDNHVEYFGFWPSTSFLDAYVRNLLKKTNINHFPNINEDLRISTRKGMKFVVNYGPVSQPTPTFSPNVKYLMGGETTPAHGVTIYIQE